jgi:hypothetical protein
MEGCGALGFPLPTTAVRPAMVFKTSGTKWLMTSRNIVLSGLELLIEMKWDVLPIFF